MKTRLYRAFTLGFIGSFGILAGATLAVAATTISGTGVSSNGSLVIDGPSTISIGTTTATGVTIGNGNSSSIITINTSNGSGLQLTEPTLLASFGNDDPYYSSLGEYTVGSGGLYTYTQADATNKTISGVTFDVGMYGADYLPMNKNQAFLINCYRPGDDALWPVEQQFTSWNQNQGGGTNYCLDGETIFAVGNDYTPNGGSDLSATPLTVVSAANGNHGGFPTGGGRVLINRNTPDGASSTLDILQIYPDRPGIRYEEAPSQTADPFSIYANDNTTVLDEINSSGGAYFSSGVGVGVDAPSASLQVATSSSNATTTVIIGKTGQTKGSCLELFDSAGTAVYAYVAAGASTFTLSATSCK